MRGAGGGGGGVGGAQGGGGGREWGGGAGARVAPVRVAGGGYKSGGGGGLGFRRGGGRGGARGRVPTPRTAAGRDLAAGREMGLPEEFARQQLAVIGAFEQMGITPLCSCTPYLAGYVTGFGQHIAWGESSAVSYANSVLGARTNREGGPGALAAAITGRTARYGLHLDENRLARFLVDVRCPVESTADYGALGYVIGKKVCNGVPYFRGLNPDSSDRLKALGAAMAASGAVALYHVEGVTPEAINGGVLAPQYEFVVVESLEAGYRGLDGEAAEVDLVWLGCPHASMEELEELARALEGRRARVALWITTSRTVREQAQERGVVARIEAGGGRVIGDTCMVVAPVEALGFRSMATNSGKGAFYGPGHAHLAVRYGSFERCLEAALSGRWPGG